MRHCSLGKNNTKAVCSPRELGLGINGVADGPRRRIVVTPDLPN